MKFKTASLLALALTLAAGIFFFVNSLHLPMTLPGIGVGAGYYPRLLSISLILASGLGLAAIGLSKEAEGAEERVRIQSPVKFFLVLAMALLLAGVWHFTRSFYPICTAVDFVLLWVLNPAPATPKKLAGTAGLTALLMAVIYALFSVILQLNL